MNITNEERAESAQVALTAFISHIHLNQEQPRDQIIDLVANLFHLCDAEKITVGSVIDQARTHYVDEKREGEGGG